MAQVKLLKLNAEGLPEEFSSTADDITLASITANGGPVMSGTGIAMSNTDLTGVQDIAFQDPSTGTINQTAGSLVIDNLMAKERNNVMSTAGAVLFPSIADSAGEVDSFKIPHLAGPPTATPAFSSAAGYMVYDDTNNNLYIWDGAAWDNLNTVTSANNTDNSYIAEVSVAARDLVYISSADNVSPADANLSDASARVLGFAINAAAPAAAVTVRDNGIITGFTGLTAGAPYYLSTTAGAVTATPPTGSGNNIVRVGFAKNTTAIHAQLQFLGKKA